MTSKDLFALIRKHPHLDLQRIAEAYAVAASAHEKQKRDGGKPYITHPAAVAGLLTEIGMDTPTVVAALLHDVIEDTPLTNEAIRKQFGEEVAFFVEGVTKLEKLPIGGNAARTETLRKMFLATAQDIRVALIKLADRLHNMQTLHVCAPEKQQRIAQETMDIYAPLAERLGMGEWKAQLEDLAFPIVYPKEYAWLMSRVGKEYGERKKYIARLVPVVRQHLAADGLVPLELHARPKHYWSLYRKLLARDMDMANLHDLVALRMVVASVEECYRALGVVHKHFTPLPGRIKDYIALPKGSGYQSLHTTVFCIDGRITEFQVRTPAMHHQAEYGIASHWMYKEGSTAQELREARKELKWGQQIKEWQKAARGSKEFVDALKLEFLKSRTFVFTPKGDIIDLPVGATPVDFAYAIHTEIGHRCAGAKADGRIVPLLGPLSMGSLVEVIARKEPQPSRDWLLSVKTSEARKKILAWFRKQEESPNIQTPVAEATRPEEAFLPKRKRSAQTPARVVTAGLKGILTRMARCCSPLPGDAIKGYVTQAYGITVHKRTCPNLQKSRDAKRHIPVSWEAGADAAYPATIKARSYTRVGLLKDVSEIIAKAGINILSLTAYDTPDGEAVQIATVEVKSVENILDLMAKIKSIRNVFSVERV